MPCEDYLEFISPDEIKIKDHRIWIEHILQDYLFRGQSAEELAKSFETLSRQQIDAVLLYYHHNKEVMDKYMAEHMEHCRESREAFSRNNQEFIVRMRKAGELLHAERKERTAV